MNVVAVVEIGAAERALQVSVDGNEFMFAVAHGQSSIDEDGWLRHL